MTPSQPKSQNSSPAPACPVEVVAELSSEGMPQERIIYGRHITPLWLLRPPSDSFPVACQRED